MRASCAPTDTLVIADDAATFAETTVSLLRGTAEAKKLGRAAREYVAREWTWERQFEKLESPFYEASADCRVNT